MAPAAARRSSPLPPLAAPPLGSAGHGAQDAQSPTAPPAGGRLPTSQHPPGAAARTPPAPALLERSPSPPPPLAGVRRDIIVHPRFARTLALPPRSPPTLEDLPVAVLATVAAALGSAQDLLRFGMVCRRAAAVAGDEHLWRRLCILKFNVPDAGARRDARVPSWRALYRCVGARRARAAARKGHASLCGPAHSPRPLPS
jgi:hypothetical protein